MTQHIDTTSIPDINPETGTRFDFTFLESPDASKALEDITPGRLAAILTQNPQELVKYWLELIRLGKEGLIIKTSHIAGYIIQETQDEDGYGPIDVFMQIYPGVASYGVDVEKYLQTVRYALTLFSLGLEDKQIGDELSPDSQELVTRTMSIIGPTIIAFTAPNN